MFARRLIRSIFSLISDVSPFTRSVKKLEAHPLPKENKLTRLSSNDAGSTVDKRDARHPYREAVYIFPSRFEHAIPGSVFWVKDDLEAPTKVFSVFLSVRETACEAERMVSGLLMLANREAFGLALKSLNIKRA